MFDAYNNSVNSSLTIQDALKYKQEDLLNVNTPGYQYTNRKLRNSGFGLILEENQKTQDPKAAIFMKGEKLTKVSIDDKYPFVYFLVKDDKNEYLTQLGDFKYTRTKKVEDTYIGKQNEERTYLTTQKDYLVMGYPIGSGQVKQKQRYKDPFNNVEHPILGESPILTQEKIIGKDLEYKFGPMVPIDLTRDSNGLILGRYTEVELDSKGIVYGNRKGLLVPLYKLALASIPNPQGLASIGDTPYFKETEESGLRQKPPEGVTVRPETLLNSNVNTKFTANDFKKLKLTLTTALSLQKVNNQIMQEFQGILS